MPPKPGVCCYLPPIISHLSNNLNTCCTHLWHFFFVHLELNKNWCHWVSFFRETRTEQAMPFTLNKLHRLRELRFFAVTVDYVRVTVQTKVNRCISWRKRQRGAERGDRKRGREETERWRWQRDIGSVTVSCRLVSSFLPSALGRSLAHNMESINPHRIPLSPPDTCPVCLPVCLSVYLSVCLQLETCTDHENLLSGKRVACYRGSGGFLMGKDRNLKRSYHPLVKALLLQSVCACQWPVFISLTWGWVYFVVDSK